MLLCPVLLYYKENSLLDVKSYRSKVFRTFADSKRGGQNFRLESGRNPGRSNDSKWAVAKTLHYGCRKAVPFQSSEPFRKSQIDRPLCSRAKKAISGYKLRINLGVFKTQILNFPVFSKWTILMSHCP